MQMPADADWDEPLEFAEEDSHAPASLPAMRWRLLVVDDDPGVHQSIVFALRDVVILDGRIEFLHAHSAREARDVLRDEQGIAVVLLDVVMEREDSGLTLVRFIREELRHVGTRIILHTGQPGYAPEIEAIRDYDINDYRTKSELTRNHLYTCVASAIRAYAQIAAIERGRHQLLDIVEAGTALTRARSTDIFLRTALHRFSTLLNVPAAGFATLHPTNSEDMLIEYAEGDLIDRLGAPVASLADRNLQQCIATARVEGGLHHCAAGAVFFCTGDSGLNLLVHIAFPPGTPEPIPMTPGVGEVLRGTLVASLDNRSLLDRLHRYAYFDRLLNLPNRRHLCESIDGQRLSSGTGPRTLALIDIDHFGDTNEALGQVFGNCVLLAVADRLSRHTPKDCLLARVSGDIFALFGPTSDVVPERLQALFLEPFEIEEEESMVSVTMGLARLEDVPGDGAAVLEAAGQALRLAKSRHRGHCAWYSPALAAQTHDRVLMLNGLRYALAQRELFVVYQPQVALADHRVVGFEALVRWRMADGNMIGPDRFIPVAEQSGLIRELGLLVLRQACETQARLHAQGHAGVRMAVNVSALQFRHPRFLDELKQIVSAAGIDPHLLELEITESVAMEDAVQLRDTLAGLRAMGVQLAIDDFGTGYSSLSQLKRMAFDRLKIDRSFVGDLLGNGAQGSIANMVIELGKRLGIQVIAEGVENESQAATLMQLGCEEAQGYFFAKPMTDAELDRWLATRR